MSSFENIAAMRGDSKQRRALALSPIIYSKAAASTREVQQGKAWSFDGVDDYVGCGSTAFGGDITACAWVKWTGGHNEGVFSKWLSNDGWLLYIHTGLFRLQVDASYISSSTTHPSLGVWQHVAITRDDATGETVLYVNGVADNTGNLATYTESSNDLEIGRYANSNGTIFTGNQADVRFYQSALSAEDIATIYNGGEVAGAFRQYNLNTATPFDSSGNDNHGTAYNGAAVVVDNTLPASADRLNEDGYTVDGAEFLPRDESDPTNDINGDPLGFSGSVYPTRPKLIDSYCGVFDGIDDKITAAHLAGTETVVSSGGTSTPTVAAGEITFTAGTCWNLVLSDGTIYPIAEGFSSTCYDVSGNGNDGTISGATTNSTGAGFWAGRQNELHYNNDSGHTSYIISGDTLRVPYDINGDPIAGYGILDAARPAIPNGFNGSETKVERLDIAEGDNPCPASNDQSATPISFSDSHADLLADSPTDSNFRRDVSAVKKDRLVVYPDTLTGGDKTAVESYTN